MQTPPDMRALLLSFLIAVFTAAPALAQNQTGSIRVVVQLQGTQEPIAGAQVTLTGVGLPAAPQTPTGTTVVSPFGGTPNAAGVTFTALTDAAGVAVFDKVPLGSYSVRTQRDGYLSATGTPLLPIANSIAVTSAILSTAQPSAAASLGLVLAGSITGRVRDAYGVPMPSARVTLSVLGYRDGHPALLPGISAQPDRQGNYRLTPVAPGEYYIRVEPTPLRGVGALYPGVADVAKATLVPVQSGQDLVGVDFDMPNIPTFKISGKMLNVPPRPQATGPNGQPLSAANSILGFTFAPADPRGPDVSGAPLMQNASRGTDEFEISMPAGYWDIYPVIPITSPGAAPNLTSGLPTYATGRARVLITDRDIQNVTITIGSSDVKGRVTGLPSGSAMARVSLVPREIMPSPLIQQLRAAQALDANGEFTFKSVPPGKYSIQIAPLPPPLHVADVRVGTKSVLDDDIITVGLDPLEPVEVVLRQGGGVVQARVTIPSVEWRLGSVVLVPDAPHRGNPLLYRYARILSSVYWDGVAPGKYKVFAFQSLPSGGAEQDEAFIAKYESFGASVEVIDGQPSNVDVQGIPKD